MTIPPLISQALERSQAITAKRGTQIIIGHELARQDREVLQANGWLQEVMKGWYIYLSYFKMQLLRGHLEIRWVYMNLLEASHHPFDLTQFAEFIFAEMDATIP